MKNLFAMLLAAALLSGCGKEQTFEPEEINPEIDVCEICNMSIAHEHYATEVISTNGDVYKFDDIGCMADFVEKGETISAEEIAKQYVRDSESGEWVELKDAYHAFHPDFWTPMANGVVTFRDQEGAEAYIGQQGMGELYNYKKLQEHKWGWEQ
ncbi:nitrous oxide reductase accessory protein NosL [Bacillus sp. ISL-47]|uniref:nitrous oxide reductase accessory protein NosL n=1 Tax=Bacillus sp. ISL-47 TaxID=2819130 RepID=UPI001BEBDCD6|nr:nitrous oxide reductase accessory protein NosL [Bacillus sp. ISL-47]MBT2688457.1 nitrous oxide reductase accessory protein NosL [Bacillus sp. ISL-47]MBT2707227.1 nitrous oxide reductase accessory protein NosL [Pseudomonas sp. ISL-84]